MGLLDSIKDGYTKNREVAAERKDVRGEKLAHAQCIYLGGYEVKHKAGGSVTFFENQIEFSTLGKAKFTLTKTLVREVAVEGKDEVHSRVTVTRLLVLGIFAFGARKKNEVKESYITIVLNDGREVVLQVNNIAPVQLKAKFSKVYAAYNQSKPLQQGSATDELERLAALKSKGVITQAEFDAKKRQLLGL